MVGADPGYTGVETNVGSNRDQLSSMAKQAREAMASDTLSVVADRGYFKSEQILACHDAGKAPR